jgi:uncharacterized membrane protein YhhN
MWTPVGLGCAFMLRYTPSDLTVPVAAYCTVIRIMICAAFCGRQHRVALTAAGAMIFAVSDT